MENNLSKSSKGLQKVDNQTKGFSRRNTTADSLAGATKVVPSRRSAPSLSVRATPAPNLTGGVSSQIGKALGKWTTESLQTVANKEHASKVLDGQMAFQQGKAIDDSSIEGNKWALEGYRVMQAQTISSAMFASQQALIEQTGYQDDPDTFRAQYISQLEQQIDGLDERTARMVQETMTKQMPTLVSQHTAANLSYKEGENFKALSVGIDTISKDATATAELIAAATGGPNSVSGGLSDDRRRKAVAEGVISAFQNGNPQAYSKLKQAGVLEDLSVTDKQAIERAQAGYQSKLRDEYNSKFIAERDTLIREISTGQMTGKKSMEAFAKLYADHGLNITATEANAAYVRGEDAVEYEQQGDTYLLAQAKAMGDTDAIDFLTQKIAAQGGPRPADAKTRAATIKAAYEELEKQSDLAATEEYRFAQAELDQVFEERGLSVASYREQSNALRNKFGAKQSSAITGHLISTINKVHKNNKSSVDANKREALDAKFEVMKATFENAIGQEGLHPDAAGRLSAEYQNAVIELYSSNGVEISDFGLASISGDIAAKYYKAETDGMKFLEDQAVIKQAARSGTISELSEKEQREYWREQGQAIGAEISGEVDRGGLSKDEAPAVLEQALLASYVQAGAVDPQVRAESIAVLSAPELVNGKGEASPQAVKTVQAYTKLRETDPRVAKTMFDEKTRLRADQIIEASGGPQGNIQDGVMRYHDASQKVGGFEENRPEITEKIVKRARKAAKQYVKELDVGFFQAVFTDATLDQASDRTQDESNVLKSEETLDLIEKLVLEETTRLSFLDPGSDPKFMVKSAVSNIKERVTFVGDTPIVMKQGKGIKAQLFGAKVREMDKPDIVNEVIVDHLQEISKLPGNEFISEVGVGGQLLSNLLEPLTGTDRPVLSGSDLIDISRRGVRPFTVLSDGERVAVRVRTETGALSEPIALDLPAIGEAYMTKYKTNLAKRDWEF